MGTLIKSKSLLREFEKTEKIMKFLAMICTAKALPIEVVVPDVDYYTNSCQAKINEIERSIKSPRSNWTKKSTPLGEFIYRKKHCERLIYDMQFCTMVCALQEGDSCTADPSEGENVCDQGLYCNNEVLSHCQLTTQVLTTAIGTRMKRQVEEKLRKIYRNLSR